MCSRTFFCFFHRTHWPACRVLRVSPSGPSPLPLFLSSSSLDLPHYLSFISSLLLSRHSTPHPPPLSAPRPQTPLPPSLILPPFIPPPPCDWVWLSSLHRGRWGHKAAGGARSQGVRVIHWRSDTWAAPLQTRARIGTHPRPFIWAVLILC